VPFDFSTGNPNNLIGDASASMGDIQGSFFDLKTFINSRPFNADYMPVGTAQQLGLNDGSGQVGRGKSIITQQDTRTGTTYSTLATPDRVSGIDLPTDGIITVLFMAFWNESVDGAGRAAIFIGSNQLSLSQVGTGIGLQECANPGAANITQPLTSCWYGLTSGGGGSAASGHAVPATTGQAVALNGNGSTDAGNQIAGGPCYIFAAAGTYDISVQFKASSGSVNVLNRRLWVKAEGYG